MLLAILPNNATTASKLAAAGQGGDTRAMLFLSVALFLLLADFLFLLLAEISSVMTSLWPRVHVLSAFLSHVLKLRRHLDDTQIVLISALCLYVFILSRYIDIVVIFLSGRVAFSAHRKKKRPAASPLLNSD